MRLVLKHQRDIQGEHQVENDDSCSHKKPKVDIGTNGLTLLVVTSLDLNVAAGAGDALPRRGVMQLNVI